MVGQGTGYPLYLNMMQPVGVEDKARYLVTGIAAHIPDPAVFVKR